MQWVIGGLLAWPTITFISTINLEKSNVEADALPRIDWEKGDETIQADSIQAIVTAAITGQGNDHIETIPCSPQAIESLLPSIPDKAQIVCNAITQSSTQCCLTCLGTASCVSETESKLANSSCPRATDNPTLNLKCITTSDWMRFNLRTKLLVISLKCIKPKNCRKVRKLIAKK